MGRIIGIISGKGGVGKTVSSTNIGLALHKFGEPTTVVDGDITSSNLGLQLGFFNHHINLQDVLDGESHIKDAVATHPSGLKIIPSAIGLESIDSDLGNLREKLNGLEGTVLLDSPPGLGEDALQILEACDEVIIVTTPELPTLTNAVKTIKIARDMKKNVLGIILNKGLGEEYELTVDEVEMMCEAHVLSTIPHDNLISKSISAKIPVVELKPLSEASIEYKRTAAKLLGKSYEAPKFLLFRRFIDDIKSR